MMRSEVGRFNKEDTVVLDISGVEDSPVPLCLEGRWTESLVLNMVNIANKR
jgi:hypothetical protein